MKISHKLIFSVIIVSSMVGVQGYIGYTGMNNIYKSLDFIVNNTSHELITLENIKSSVFRAQMESLSFTLQSDEEELEEFEKAIKDHILGIEEFKKFAEEDEIPGIKEFETASLLTITQCQKLIELKQSGARPDELLETMQELENAEEEFLLAINNAISSEFEEFDEQGMMAQNQLESLTVAALIVGLGGMILALILGVIISKSITGPLNSLKSSAEEIAQGNMDTKILIKGANEISQLADEFDNMRVSLKVMMEKYDHSSIKKQPFEK